MIKKYRKKPVVIEAVQWTGDNVVEVSKFVGVDLLVHEDFIDNDIKNLEIKTLEGTHTASKGDFIIKGVKGEFYPCKLDIFEQTYEEVE